MAIRQAVYWRGRERWGSVMRCQEGEEEKGVEKKGEGKEGRGGTGYPSLCLTYPAGVPCYPAEYDVIMSFARQRPDRTSNMRLNDARRRGRNGI